MFKALLQGAIVSRMVVRKEFNKEVEAISVYDPYLHYAMFNSIVNVLTDAPENSIILLEDIDAMFVQREYADEMFRRKLSFYGFLNALDGIRSQQG